MKTSVTAVFVLLCGAINALPSSELSKRADPEATPVSVENLPQDATWTCGSTKYTTKDVYKAIQWGVLLAESDPPQGRGKKSNEYPIGRFPHSFTQNTGGLRLPFPSYCPADDDTRAEYPLVLNGPYNGGISNNVNWGPDRVVYMHEKGEIDFEGHDHANFCGVMTHTGAPTAGSFVLCSSP